jgi:hypothetical protein
MNGYHSKSFIRRVAPYIGLVIVLFLLLLGSGFIIPASAAPMQDIKIDPNIYTGINAQGNPTGAQPHDYTWFHFRVTFTKTVYETNAAGVPTGKVHFTSYPVGVYDANTVFQNAFPKMYGNPDTTDVTKQCMMWGLFCWYEKTVTAYHVDTYDVPYGYCPMYPQGQDYKKGDTTTVVWKFFKGTYCGVYIPPTVTTYQRVGGVIRIA